MTDWIKSGSPDDQRWITNWTDTSHDSPQRWEVTIHKTGGSFFGIYSFTEEGRTVLSSWSPLFSAIQHVVAHVNSIISLYDQPKVTCPKEN